MVDIIQVGFYYESFTYHCEYLFYYYIASKVGKVHVVIDRHLITAQNEYSAKMAYHSLQYLLQEQDVIG